MKKYLTLDFVIAVVLLAVSIGFWILSCQFPAASAMFPRIFLGCTIVLSGIMLIGEVMKQAKNGEAADPEKNFLKEFSLPFRAYCIMVLYVLGIRYIGFFVSTSVFMLVFMWFLNVRKPIRLIAVTAGMDLFLYLMFVLGLKLSLPAGILI